MLVFFVTFALKNAEGLQIGQETSGLLNACTHITNGSWLTCLGRTGQMPGSPGGVGLPIDFDLGWLLELGGARPYIH